MTCTVNGELVPCDFFWSHFGWIFVIAFLLPGLFLFYKKNTLLDQMRIKNQREFPSEVDSPQIDSIYQRVSFFISLFSLILIFIGWFCLYLVLNYSK